ncbi:MAG: hypothetical protein COA78_03970 [Blastopirellula sp.]|nr:MAG: hypothetical protein COA78_03970 [Blastopirellula sp.]
MYIVVMLFAGSLIALQSVFNGLLGKSLDHPFHAAIVSFVMGLLALLILTTVTQAGLPSLAQVSAVPKVLLLGGVIGAVFVTTVIFCMPHIGVANVVMASLCGQIIFSLFLDHIGAFGIDKYELDARRVVGALLIIVGVFIINYHKS